MDVFIVTMLFKLLHKRITKRGWWQFANGRPGFDKDQRKFTGDEITEITHVYSCVCNRVLATAQKQLTQSLLIGLAGDLSANNAQIQQLWDLQ